MKTNSSDVFLAGNWTKSKILAALKHGRQRELCDFLDRRYSERYFWPLADLEDSHQLGYGFAVMSLCCLLIETIQSYREGLPSTNAMEIKKLVRHQSGFGVPASYLLPADLTYNTEQAFVQFFLNPAHSKFFPGVDGRIFYHAIRNGLLHQAQTKDGWRIRIEGPLWDAKAKTLNRELFVDALRNCFKAYLTEFRKAGKTDDLYALASRKVWWLCYMS